MKRLLLMACVGVLGCVAQGDDEVDSTGEGLAAKYGEVCSEGPKTEPFQWQKPKFDTDKRIVLLMRDAKEPQSWSYLIGIDVGSKRAVFSYYLADQDRLKALTWVEVHGLDAASQGRTGGGSGGGTIPPIGPPPGVWDSLVDQGTAAFNARFIERTCDLPLGY